MIILTGSELQSLQLHHKKLRTETKPTSLLAMQWSIEEGFDRGAKISN